MIFIEHSRRPGAEVVVCAVISASGPTAGSGFLLYSRPEVAAFRRCSWQYFPLQLLIPQLARNGNVLGFLLRNPRIQILHHMMRGSFIRSLTKTGSRRRKSCAGG